MIPPVLLAACRPVVGFAPRSCALGAGEATGPATAISIPVALVPWLTSTGMGAFNCPPASGVGAGLDVDCPDVGAAGAGELLPPPQAFRKKQIMSKSPKRHTRIVAPP